jgi:hypothetical protein
MPDLTPEQKEHLKMAHRSHERIQETWNLYTLFLQTERDPGDALRRAVEASTVWAEWQDNNEVEFPEIERPDFVKDLGEAMGQMMKHVQRNPSGSGGISIGVDPETGRPVEAIFNPGPDDPPDTRTTHPNPADQPDSTTK